MVMHATMPASNIPSAKSAAPQWPMNRLERLRQIAAASKFAGAHVVGEERRRGDDRGDGGGGGKEPLRGRVARPKPISRGVRPLSDGGALLEEEHPGRDGGADIREQDQEHVSIDAAGKRLPGDERVADGAPQGWVISATGTKIRLNRAAASVMRSQVQ